MSLRTQAVSVVRLFAACILAVSGFQANAQTPESPSINTTGLAGFYHVGEAMSVTATVSTLTNFITGGDVTFTVLDASTIDLYSNSVARTTSTGGESVVHVFNVTLDASGFGTFTQTFSGTTPFVSALATVESCAPPKLTGPIDGLKSARRAKARSVSSGCPATSEYSPTVAVALLGPAITLDTASLTFSAAAGSSSASQTVSLTNSGNQPLTFAATPFTFPADYVLTHTCPLPPAQLAVAATCQVTLIFNAPATPGTSSGVLKVSSDALNSASASVALTSISMAPPSLAVTPAAHDFGDQEVGTASAPQTFTVSNNGSAPVDIVSVLGSGDFAAQSSCPATLAKGATCTIDVKFVPSAVGVQSGTFTINATDGAHVQPLAGRGTAPIAPAIGVTPASLAFGSRTLGTVSPAQTLTVVNSGSAPLLILVIAVSGDFAYTSTCPASLAPGASCSIGVKFTPLVSGNRDGSLAIITNAAGSPTFVALSGIGVDIAVGTLDIAPASLDFGAQPLRLASAPQLVNVTNVGTLTVFILDIALTGDFAFGDVPAGSRACGGPLPPAESCLLAVSFVPTAVGDRGGLLRISSDGTNFSGDVALTGFGVAVEPQRALDVPAALQFGPQPFGTRSAGVAMVLANRSPGPVVVTDIDASGDFSVSESCTAIPAGGSCTATVFFAPSARGDRTGTLTIRIQSEALPYTVALAGEGAANPVPILSVTPTRIGFGNTFVGMVSTLAAVTLANVGEAPLLLDGLTAPGDFIVDSHCGAVLAAGASCAVDVRFFPRMLDARGGTLEIRSNAAGAPHYVDLSGTGCSIPNVGRSRIPQLLCGP